LPPTTAPTSNDAATSSTTAPLRVALIGCGAIAHEHVAALRPMIATGEVRLVGVCDTSPATARWFGDRYGVPHFVDAPAMLDSTAANVVHVLTPPSSHAALTRLALAAGAHVIVEKPLASSLIELDELLALAEGADRTLVENQNYRYNDGVVAVKQALESGRLGELVELEIALNMDLTGVAVADPHLRSPVGHLRGGAARDYLPHLAGLLLDLSGEQEPLDVRSRWWNRSGNTAAVYDEVDATVDLGGALGRIRFSSNIRPIRFGVVARGTRGVTSVDLFQPHRQLHVDRGPTVLSPVIDMALNGALLIGWSGRTFKNKVMQHTALHGVPRFVQATYRAIATGATPPLTRDQIRRTAKLVEAVAEGADR
jgi:predicted dehydrogenase